MAAVGFGEEKNEFWDDNGGCEHDRGVCGGTESRLGGVEMVNEEGDVERLWVGVLSAGL